ncbi:MAG: serine--tRNA ligase, partial [Oscillospiraceae bacterium]|nr:serine--tRNA ligase [Oscillospiraceae bacterium]
MLDIKLLRENPELVKENIKKKYQDEKLPLVDEVIELDKLNRAAISEASDLRAQRNALSKANGPLFGRLKKAAEEEKAAIQAEIDANTAKVKENDARLGELEKLEEEYAARIRAIMMVIPNIIDDSVPLGPDDSYNVEVQRFGEAVTPDFDVPYHTEIMERFDGVDMDAAGRVSGNG